MTLFRLFFVLALLVPAPPHAQGLFGDDEKRADARLLAGWEEPGGRRVAGLAVELAPGWKTYWRTPGDAGIPPQFDWSGSENLADVRVAWPTPVVFDTFGLRTIGYKDRMVLPLQLTPADPAKPIRLRLALFYGLCEEICIPAQVDLALDIPPGAPRDGAAAIRTALTHVPMQADAAGLLAATCEIDGDGAERTLTASLRFTHPRTDPPVVVAEGPDGVWIGPMETRIEDGEIVASGEIQVDPGVWIDRRSLRITLLGGLRGIALNGCGEAG